MKLDEKTIKQRKENLSRSVIEELLELNDEIGIYSVIEMITGYARLNSDELLEMATGCTNEKGLESLRLDMQNNGTSAQLASTHLAKIQDSIKSIELLNEIEEVMK